MVVEDLLVDLLEEGALPLDQLAYRRSPPILGETGQGGAELAVVAEVRVEVKPPVDVAPDDARVALPGESPEEPQIGRASCRERVSHIV
jgi:hypothetical protein